MKEDEILMSNKDEVEGYFMGTIHDQNLYIFDDEIVISVDSKVEQMAGE